MLAAQFDRLPDPTSSRASAEQHSDTRAARQHLNNTVLISLNPTMGHLRPAPEGRPSVPEPAVTGLLAADGRRPVRGARPSSTRSSSTGSAMAPSSRRSRRWCCWSSARCWSSAFFWRRRARPPCCPGKLQFAGEGIYGFVRNGVAIEILGGKNGRSMGRFPGHPVRVHPDPEPLGHRSVRPAAGDLAFRDPGAAGRHGVVHLHDRRDPEARVLRLLQADVLHPRHSARDAHPADSRSSSCRTSSCGRSPWPSGCSPTCSPVTC